jgi:hypothetical protein
MLAKLRSGSAYDVMAALALSPTELDAT